MCCGCVLWLCVEVACWRCLFLLLFLLFLLLLFILHFQTQDAPTQFRPSSHKREGTEEGDRSRSRTPHVHTMTTSPEINITSSSSSSWMSVASDEDVSDTVGENAAQSWTHIYMRPHCGHATVEVGSIRCGMYEADLS